MVPLPVTVSTNQYCLDDYMPDLLPATTVAGSFIPLTNGEVFDLLKLNLKTLSNYFINLQAPSGLRAVNFEDHVSFTVALCWI